MGVAPVGPVGGPRHVGVVLASVLPGSSDGPAGEGLVVGLEDLLGHVRGGGHHNGAGPILEVEEGAIGLGEGVPGAVGDGANLVEVANDRPWFGTWWEFLFWMAVVVVEFREDR